MKRIVLLYLILLVSSLFATEKVTVLEVKGYGITRAEAIQNTLVEAIKQKKGVSIDSQKAFTKSIRQKSSSNNGENSREFGVDSISQNRVKEATKGYINEYRVIDEQKASDGEWEVTLAIKFLEYKAPGLSHKSRRKIAIMPFYTAQNSFRVGGKTFYSVKITDDISQALTSSFTQSRKFAVLDRTYTYDMARELNMIGSDATPLSEKVKLGQRLGADYILVGTIKKANMQNHVTRNQSLGTVDSKSVAEFIIDYRIIVVGTSQIKWSDTAKAQINMKQSDSVDMAMQNAVEKVSEQITTSLLSNIYPMRIAQITKSREIVLNQGGNSVHVGMKMNVMHQGEKIIDPYTKESLGRTETKVAQIEITRVTPKLSYAKLTEGTFTLLKKNDICRREKMQGGYGVQKEEDNPAWRKTDVKVNKGGGVVLPF